MSLEFTCSPLGDSALLLYFGQNTNADTSAKIQQATALLKEAHISGIEDLVPAYTTLTVFYDPTHFIQLFSSVLPYESVKSKVTATLSQGFSHVLQKSRQIELPVCYEDEFAPDLEQVARHCELSTNEVVTLHSERNYQVQFLGFAPGFPYLSGMNRKLATPRLDTPRLKIAAGSVGIAGEQTGIYPLASPGGWQIIGRTPIKLINFNNPEPTYMQSGDILRFVPITRLEFDSLEARQ